MAGGKNELGGRGKLVPVSIEKKKSAQGKAGIVLGRTKKRTRGGRGRV